MTIYVVLLSSIIILGVRLEKKNRKIYSIISCVLFTIVAALRRYNIGNDTINYISLFERVLNNIEIYGLDFFKISRFENRFCAFNDYN